MKLEIKFFGELAEKCGTDIGHVELKGPSDLKSLRSVLESSYPLKDSYFRFSVNRKLMDEGGTELKQGDEIALLPPFAGG